ncbi:type II 3-dehydroquinate dehydratase [Salinibacterium sp. SWN1162]|uniref:type II 3-dehydroquinate dehydratase n=1 Tax=Salinibacterium sp. SWN1162 TaxID=2792053 RepID=UPI0018CD2404|nr:type II 3-dehydroquinate dehydratase [Salinibacterium sp. SWN1162]MBH0009283.1 3-dehydroquinate dehydratase [Salinibacterium sp. SWN1162]
MTTVFVLNGPNLGRLGSREPDVYGGGTLVDLQAQLEAHVQTLPNAASITLDFRQTDSETELISWLHEAVDAGAPVIMNPAAFTHYSYALRDAAAQVSGSGLPLIEVHITNPHTREEFRHTSVISGVATGVIAGFGFESYILGLDAVARRLS